MLGALLLEAASVPEALVRLRTAISVDPSLFDARLDLARGHALMGEWDAALALLGGDPASPTNELGRAVSWARLRLWNPALPPPPPLPPDPGATEPRRFLRRVFAFLDAVGRTRSWPDEEVVALLAANVEAVGRLQSVRLQYRAETEALLGRFDDAEETARCASEHGMMDLLWLDRCPLLEPLRARPGYASIRAAVAARAAAVAAAGS